MRREHPQLWRDLPESVRETVHRRVQEQLPEIVHEVTDEIGDNIDQLLDIKLMVIRHLEERPGLVNRVYQETGERELKFIINFGFFFGFALGIPVIFLTHALPYWWVLPIAGAVIGATTNWLALKMIFEPAEPRKIGRFTVHGLFLKRQPEAADVYADGDRRRHRDARQHRRRAAARPALGPHPADDRHGAAAGRGPRHGARPRGGAGGGGHARVRHDPRLGGHRGGGLHDDPADRRRSSTSSRARRSAS